MKPVSQVKLLAVLTVAIIFISSIFTVSQRQHAVVFQFGEAVRTINEPGLFIRAPLIQNVMFFDKRVLHIDAEAKELTASDGKKVIVDAYAKYRIIDPITFYKTVNNVQGLNVRLNKILESAMRKVIGKSSFAILLSPERSSIMHLIKDYVTQESKNFGIEIVDVRILRTDLPKENSSAIYVRMQTEREKEARLFRAEGLEESERIRSKADKESQILKADAYMKAQIIKGEGDSEASKIYNDAYGKDPEFYRFYRHVKAYRESLAGGDLTIVLSPESKFLQYLQLGK